MKTNPFLLWLIAVLSTGSWTVQPASFQKAALAADQAWYYEHDPYSQVTVLQIAIRGGKRAEGDLPGLAWLSLKMGLEPHSSNNLNEMMEQGANLTVRVHGDFSLITLRVLSVHFAKAVDLIRRSLFDPLINSIRLDLIAKTMAHYREYVDDSPEGLAYFAQLRSFFPDDPYRHKDYGEDDSAEKIQVADIKSFFARSLRSGNLVMAVSSDLPAAQLTGLMQKLVEKVPPGERLALSQARPGAAPVEAVRIPKERVQSLISSAWLLPASTARQRLLGLFLKTLLSDGVGSRFWALRSERNLVYSSSAELVQLQDHALLSVSLRCEDGKSAQVVENLEQILQNLQENGVDEEEFAQTRAYAQTTFYRDSENKEEKCYWTVLQDVLDMKCDFLKEFASVSAQISRQEFNAFLKTELGSGKRSLVVVGPGSQPGG